MAKHFILNTEKAEIDKEALAAAQREKSLTTLSAHEQRRERTKTQMSLKDGLRHVYGRIVVKADVLFKNSHRFENGIEIALQRGYNEFNQRKTQPVNVIVISGENIPEGSEALVNHNALHDSNKIFDYRPESGPAETTDVRYFSIPEDEFYAWRVSAAEPFKPMKNFEFGLRVFRPYSGVIEGIAPTIVKDCLLVQTGLHKGKIVRTLAYCDYEIIYQTEAGREGSIIRFRHSDTEELEREEVIGIDHELTELYNNGKLLAGFTVTDCKTKE